MRRSSQEGKFNPSLSRLKLRWTRSSAIVEIVNRSHSLSGDVGGGHVILVHSPTRLCNKVGRLH